MKRLKELIQDKEIISPHPDLEKLRRLIPAIEVSLGYKSGSLAASLITEKRIVFETSNHTVAQDFYLKIGQVETIIADNFEGDRQIKILVR